MEFYDQSSNECFCEQFYDYFDYIALIFLTLVWVLQLNLIMESIILLFCIFVIHLVTYIVFVTNYVDFISIK